jgi:hypothetical protein
MVMERKGGYDEYPIATFMIEFGAFRYPLLMIDRLFAIHTTKIQEILC